VRLFDLFGREKVEPLWEFTTGGVLWHVRGVDSRFLLGEERDPETRQVAFFCLDAADGRLLWRNPGFGQQWWIGISTVFRETVLLHGFRSPDMPIPHGIIGVDLATGERLWERQDFTLRGVRGEHLVAESLSAEGDAFWELTVRDGQPAAPLPAGTPVGFPSPDASSEFPNLVEEVAGENPGLPDLLGPYLAGRCAGTPVAVYVRHNRIAAAFHESRPESSPEAPRYRHVLMVIDTGQQRTTFRRVLDADVPKLIPDPFFVVHDTLYCIRERRTLIAVPFGGSRETDSAR
jgi:hypothetical protein